MASDQAKVTALVQLIRKTVDTPTVKIEALEKIKSGYEGLKRDDKPSFFSQLLDVVEVGAEDVRPWLEETASATDDPALWRRSLVDLRSRIESPRWRLFRHFIRVPGGLKFLLDLRADIRTAQRHGVPDLKPLDHDLVRLFESWFQHGFLFLHEITLDSPYRQIVIISNGDMVHPMSRLEEMAQRLGRDRRCFALYHQAMPEEPVVFIEVALTNGIVRSIHDIIGPEVNADEENMRRDTAVFYSINNTQNGLAGLGLGNVLIFQVVEFLKREVPSVKNFCTLSPLPGFWRRYLRPILEENQDGFRMSAQSVGKLFDKKAKGLLEEEWIRQSGRQEEVALADTLFQVFSNPAWAANETLVSSLARPLRRLGYIYLAEEKKEDGRPLDPVANFHLGNGATLSPADVNFGANWSAMGIGRSLSLMANYIYTQQWRSQIWESMSRLGGLLPGLSRRSSDKRPEWLNDQIIGS